MGFSFPPTWCITWFMANQLILAPTTALDQPLDVNRLVEAWVSGRSPKTVEAYHGDLAAFVRWRGASSVGDELARFLSGTMGAANEQLHKYRGDMLDKGLAPATVNRRLSAMRSVVRLGRRFGMVQWSLEVDGVKAQAYRDTSGPGLQGMAKAIHAAAAQRHAAKAARDVALLTLLHDLGLRRNEVVTLDLEHLDLYASRVWVLGKGRRERAAVTLQAATIRALDAWLKHRGKEPGALFFNLAWTKGGRQPGTARLTGRGIHHVLKGIGVDADIVLRPHGIRHSSITTGLDRTKDPRAVQQHARHASIETTMHYDDNLQDLGGVVSKAVSEALVEAIGARDTFPK
jgi:integrase/recombinase XerC